MVDRGLSAWTFLGPILLGSLATYALTMTLVVQNVTRVASDLEHHEQLDAHPGASRTAELRMEFRRIDATLVRYRARIENLENLHRRADASQPSRGVGAAFVGDP